MFHKIIKSANKIENGNCLLINKYTNDKLLSTFTNWFTFFSVSHNCQASFPFKINLQIPIFQTASCVKNTIVYLAIRSLNDVQKELNGVMLNKFSPVKVKLLIVECYLNKHKKL